MALRQGKDYDVDDQGNIVYSIPATGKPRKLEPEQAAYVLAVLYRIHRKNWANYLLGYELDQPGGPGSKYQ